MSEHVLKSFQSRRLRSTRDPAWLFDLLTVAAISLTACPIIVVISNLMQTSVHGKYIALCVVVCYSLPALVCYVRSQLFDQTVSALRTGLANGLRREVIGNHAELRQLHQLLKSATPAVNSVRGGMRDGHRLSLIAVFVVFSWGLNLFAPDSYRLSAAAAVAAVLCIFFDVNYHRLTITIDRQERRISVVHAGGLGSEIGSEVFCDASEIHVDLRCARAFIRTASEVVFIDLSLFSRPHYVAALILAPFVGADAEFRFEVSGN